MKWSMFWNYETLVALKGAFKLQLINSRLDNSELANHLIETKRKFLFDIKMKTTICLFLAATCIAVTLASPGHRHHGRPRLQPKGKGTIQNYLSCNLQPIPTLVEINGS